jgi:hypothetical protein
MDVRVKEHCVEENEIHKHERNIYDSGNFELSFHSEDSLTARTEG